MGRARTAAAAAGLSAVLLANANAYLAMRIAGGLVLAVLGLNTLLTLRRSERALVSRPTVHRRLQVATGCGLLCLGAVVAVGV